MRRNRLAWVTVILALLPLACGNGAPDADGLRDSFAAQLEANTYVSDVQHDGDAITFSGPDGQGGTGPWRIVIDATTVEANDDPSLPYRGTVVSSWYADGQIVVAQGSESNLPIELTSNGLAQDCWALWNADSERWEWE